MLNYIEVEYLGKRIAAELTPITFLTGNGKSFLIYEIINTIKNIGYKIPKISYKNFKIVLRIKDMTYALQRAGPIYRQTLERGKDRVIFEYGTINGVRISRLIEPSEMSVKSADVIMPFVEVTEHVAILADEEIERLNKLIGEFRKAFSLRALLIGPFVSPRTFYRPSEGKTELRPDGSNLVGVLSMLAYKSPDDFERLRSMFKKIGVKLAVGLTNKNILGGAVYIQGVRLPLSKLPCSLKMALTIGAAVASRPDILAVDNLDYCFNENVASVLAAFLEEQASRGQVIAEVHNPAIVEHFKAQYKSVVSVSL
ncbi:Predicted DNA binding protein, contains leucin zipper domain [Thermoproteus tenax Kra 1]|uniref:Predicted DNA binding protein, contains leucin zipper domain n=2 Tax=Thermoproteus tenax TaxID=2271 RepID=G4RPG9_THETK|nr:Predicted DNA binding protein, contains leucin zipper domain [Thermoproteus tenax Kra 1]